MADISKEQHNELIKIGYDAIIKAGKTLCNYCDVNECEKCIVTHLIDDATNEAIESGIIEEN